MGRLSFTNLAALALGLAFLYLPIAILVVYSFNAAGLVAVWGGWSTRWYAELAGDAPLIDSALKAARDMREVVSYQPLLASEDYAEGIVGKSEPMHQVFLGARALLYLDGRADAGLSQSLELTAVGLVIGLLLGGVVTRIYDRRGYHRLLPGLAAAPTSTPETTAVADATYPE